MKPGLTSVLTVACTLVLLVGVSAGGDYYQCYQFGSCTEPTLSNDSNCRQLELSRQFRADLVNTSSGFNDLRNLIYGAIRQAMVDMVQDSFTGKDGLITNEYAHWNSDGIRSPDWDMTSGSLFRQSNTAWTGLPDSIAPNKFSSDHTGSDVFRLNTFRTFAGNIKVSLALKNNREIHDPNCSANDTCWHGVHVWLRHLSQYDLYAVSLNRADNKVVIKRKVPCGNSNGGSIRTWFLRSHTRGQWGHGSTTQ